MYVIEFFDASAGTAGETTYYPADRCTWRMAAGSNPSDRYEPIGVMFYPGNTGAVNLTGATGDRITFGFIGKSGRFVAMTGTNVRP